MLDFLRKKVSTRPRCECEATRNMLDEFICEWSLKYVAGPWRLPSEIVNKAGNETSLDALNGYLFTISECKQEFNKYLLEFMAERLNQDVMPQPRYQDVCLVEETTL